MGVRFRKTIRVGKAFRINLSKSGVGCSAYIPGTGLGVGYSPPRARQAVRTPGGQGMSFLTLLGWGVVLVVGWVFVSFALAIMS